MHSVPAHSLVVYEEKSLSILAKLVRKTDVIPEWTIRAGPADGTQLPLRLHLGPGAVLFGIGRAMTGACPGVALVSIGQGQLSGLLSGVGFLMGIWLQTVFSRKSQSPASR